jgi:UDP-glucose 4-epimerase
VNISKVLITGGSGFIGGHICRELKGHGVTPLIYDLRPPPTKDGLEWVQGDVTDLAALREAAEGTDAILHLASLISVRATEDRPRQTLDVAILGTRNACLAAGPGRPIVMASTSEVYGDAVQVPTPETCPPSPKSTYGVAKLAAEAYIRTCVGGDGPYFTVLRLFSVYGPGQEPNFVIPRFVSQALRTEPITVYGGGDQVRAFAHVVDVARGTVSALLSPRARGRTYNLGNPTEPITILELARRVAEICGSTSEVVRLPFEASDRTAQREIYRRIPDIKAAADDLGYRPQIALEQGIEDVVAHYRT